MLGALDYTTDRSEDERSVKGREICSTVCAKENVQHFRVGLHASKCMDARSHWCF